VLLLHILAHAYNSFVPWSCAGKSTLINAILGNEILPVNNVPETARISRITHSPSADCPEPTLEFKSAADAASSSSNSPRAFGLAGTSSALAGAAAAAEDCDLARMFSTGSSSSSNGDGSGDNKLRGAEQIREHLQQLNRDARSREHMRSDDQVRTRAGALSETRPQISSCHTAFGCRGSHAIGG
jgi:hypothetical protein